MANSPLLPDHARDPKQPEVCDDHFAVIIKDILGLEVFVHDALGMKIPHALQDSQPCIRGVGDAELYLGRGALPIPPPNLEGYRLHLTDEATEAQRGQVTAPDHTTAVNHGAQI